MKRNATANWQGSGKEGKGTLSTQSTVLNNNQYSWSSRFENGIGTNPEELIAAAHAGCFSMKLSFLLGGAGFVPVSIDTNCAITMEDGAINASHITVSVNAPGISKEKLDECVADAKANCPVSKLLNCVITCEATMI